MDKVGQFKFECLTLKITAQRGKNNCLMQEKLLTIQEAAEMLGVSTKTLRRWDQRGILVSQRTAGNQRRYKRDVITGFRKPKYSPQNKPIISTSVNFGLPSALKNLNSSASTESESTVSISSSLFHPVKPGQVPEDARLEAKTKSFRKSFLLGLILVFSAFAFVFSLKYGLGHDLLSGGGKLAQLAELLPREFIANLQDPNLSSSCNLYTPPQFQTCIVEV